MLNAHRPMITPNLELSRMLKFAAAHDWCDRVRVTADGRALSCWENVAGHVYFSRCETLRELREWAEY